jgi:hypothetical protein
MLDAGNAVAAHGGAKGNQFGFAGGQIGHGYLHPE